MLLGFYDRNGDGLAVELTPEMAKAIASRARRIFDITQRFDCFSATSEIRQAELAFEVVYVTNSYASKKGWNGEFFSLGSYKEKWDLNHESTGVWIDITGDEPAVFWEVFNSKDRQNTPYLSLAQLDAIANNQPLPQE